MGAHLQPSETRLPEHARHACSGMAAFMRQTHRDEDVAAVGVDHVQRIPHTQRVQQPAWQCKLPVCKRYPLLLQRNNMTFCMHYQPSSAHPQHPSLLRVPFSSPWFVEKVALHEVVDSIVPLIL